MARKGKMAKKQRAATPSVVARVKAEPEGRDGIWIPDRDDLVAWIKSGRGAIHCIIPVGPVLTGADWTRAEVVKFVREADRLAVMTGPAARSNLAHNLAAISDNTLYMFDTGEPPLASPEVPA